MSAPVKHNLRLSVIAFVLTLLGLMALLIVPVVARQYSDRLHARIEDQVEPAREKINETMTEAHEIQFYLSNLYFFNDTNAPQPFSMLQYHKMVEDWKAFTANDNEIQPGGSQALQHWKNGKALLNQWLDRYQKNGSGPFEQGPESTERNAPLFRSGIRELKRAREATSELQIRLRQDIDFISRLQVSITVPLALICLLLAVLFWRNLLSLHHSWAREQETTARLAVTIQETNHRIKNNLQVVSSLLDMQMLEAEDAVPKAALADLVQQVNAVAAVHDFLSHELRGDMVQGDRMLEKLVQLVAQPAGLEVHLEAETVGLEVKQATALALITNELLLNAGKHGATEARVCIHSEGNVATLQVADNGPGFPESFDPVRDANMGIALIDTLTRHDLAGDVAFLTQNGALVKITFPLSPL